LRRRLLLWFVVATALVFGLGVAVANVVVGRQLESRVDQDLVGEISLYQRAVETATDEAVLVALTRDYLSAAESQRLRLSGMVLTLQMVDGSVVSNSADIRLEEVALPEAVGLGGRALVTSGTAAGPYRIAVTPVVMEGRAVGQLRIASPVQSLSDIRRQMLLVMLSAALAGIVAVGVGAWYLLGRTLRPVRELTRTAAAISREDLSRRIDYQGPPDEIGDLAATMNGMLDRLEEAFAAQDQFVSDVSHELRTPLTIVKGHLQVLDREESFEPDLVRREHALVLEELDRMNRLVAELLTLARVKRSDFLRREKLEADGFLRALAEQGPHIGKRDWVIDELPGAPVWADQDRLTQVFLNLMQNAVAHTAQGDTVALGGRSRDDSVQLWVRDAGPGMTDEVKARLFERFYRGPETRNPLPGRDGEGSWGFGLGLAIAKALVDAHGGRIEVESSLGEGSRFTVVLPPKGDAAMADERTLISG